MHGQTQMSNLGRACGRVHRSENSGVPHDQVQQHLQPRVPSFGNRGLQTEDFGAQSQLDSTAQEPPWQDSELGQQAGYGQPAQAHSQVTHRSPQAASLPSAVGQMNNVSSLAAVGGPSIRIWPGAL
jgi:hypothetical protein